MSTNQCSLSARTNGPWHCSSGGCNGGDGCRAPRLNASEAAWLERHAYDNAWLEHYGLPVLTISDARREVSRLLR